MNPVEAHWLALEADLADYLAKKGITPSCRAGCFACCHGLVTLSRLEGEALLPHLSEAQRSRLLKEGPRRLALLREGKDDPRFPSQFFLTRTPCPFLEEGLCGVYPWRPLACRGLLTQGDPRLCEPEAGLQRGHFLSAPWRMARLRMEAGGEEVVYGVENLKEGALTRFGQGEGLRGGVLEGECAKLLKGFFARLREGCRSG
ncbi:hypothetical protein CSW47_03350 [Thermus scotoductus]|uniref:Zinc/iron-chelating domain-containing protein n=1 Tax=Thermus scotoductus TaxID=37636 RepID=A0A430RFF4_THESC|nr:YkgJ family cysteine cluster protein [Thermus scotoductus]RTH06478.1 hypothetical protein CSW47_03350 [Thermus scotoductus]